jgi:hypothetical protein
LLGTINVAFFVLRRKISCELVLMHVGMEELCQYGTEELIPTTVASFNSKVLKKYLKRRGIKQHLWERDELEQRAERELEIEARQEGVEIAELLVRKLHGSNPLPPTDVVPVSWESVWETTCSAANAGVKELKRYRKWMVKSWKGAPSVWCHSLLILQAILMSPLLIIPVKLFAKAVWFVWPTQADDADDAERAIEERGGFPSMPQGADSGKAMLYWYEVRSFLEGYTIIGIWPPAAHDGSEVCCSICLSSLVSRVEYRELRCGHRFHPNCIDGWLCKKQECALCRKPLTLAMETVRSANELRREQEQQETKEDEEDEEEEEEEKDVVNTVAAASGEQEKELAMG